MSDIANSSIVQAIESGLSTVAGLGETLDPALKPAIVLGLAVAQAVPGLIDDVINLIGGSAPSDADKAALASRIAQLSDPGDV